MAPLSVPVTGTNPGERTPMLIATRRGPRLTAAAESFRSAGKRGHDRRSANLDVIRTIMLGDNYRPNSVRALPPAIAARSVAVKDATEAM